MAEIIEMKNGIKKKRVEVYRGYNIYEITTPCKSELLYNANRIEPDAICLITCVGNSLEEVKANINKVYKRLEVLYGKGRLR